MAKLIFENSGEEVELPNGSSIAEACETAGVPFACSEGVCGTCVIEILDGADNLSPPTEEETDFLGDDAGEERLACQTKILRGTVTVRF